jgi:hypothetical protein
MIEIENTVLIWMGICLYTKDESLAWITIFPGLQGLCGMGHNVYAVFCDGRLRTKKTEPNSCPTLGTNQYSKHIHFQLKREGVDFPIPGSTFLFKFLCFILGMLVKKKEYFKCKHCGKMKIKYALFDLNTMYFSNSMNNI